MTFRTSTFDAAAEGAYLDCSPFLAALDEAAYVEAIMPLIYTDGAFAVTIDTREDEAAEAALHSEPQPGHFHYLDAGYW